MVDAEAHSLQLRSPANGLSHISSLNVVHGDRKLVVGLSQDNFSVTEGGIVKITDLGSREHTGFTTTILPYYLFIAPELIIPDEDDVSMPVTKASNV
jgi:serine/threonine protein kinase